MWALRMWGGGGGGQETEMTFIRDGKLPLDTLHHWKDALSYPWGRSFNPNTEHYSRAESALVLVQYSNSWIRFKFDQTRVKETNKLDIAHFSAGGSYNNLDLANLLSFIFYNKASFDDTCNPTLRGSHLAIKEEKAPKRVAQMYSLYWSHVWPA